MAGSVNAPWYKERGYTHFDLPMSEEAAFQLVSDSDRVASHSFWPLLSFKQRVRLWKKRPDGTGYWRVKSRPIAYAAHADSQIFAYYAFELQRLYEAKLRAERISECVLAYRRIPRVGSSSSGKANYDFAAEAFVEIASRSDCDVIALDIKSFFDNIPHVKLKEQWKRLLGVAELPADQFTVFKAATKFARVSVAALRKELTISVRGYKRLKRIPISSAEFREKIRDKGLVCANTDRAKPWGIPQGLPISGMLANLALLDVDVGMRAAADEVGGVYRRYSDDVLIIAPPGCGDSLEKRFGELLSTLAPLSVQTEKTVRCAFFKDGAGRLSCDRPLQYLGFEFDGQRVLLRPQTLAKYSKRMLRAVRTASRAAARSTEKGEPIRIRRRDLFARFTHLEPHPETPREKRPRGSFYKYGRRAEDAFNRASDRATLESQIKRQLRKSTARLVRLIEEAESNAPRNR